MHSRGLRPLQHRYSTYSDEGEKLQGLNPKPYTLHCILSDCRRLQFTHQSRKVLGTNLRRRAAPPKAAGDSPAKIGAARRAEVAKLVEEAREAALGPVSRETAALNEGRIWFSQPEAGACQVHLQRGH